MFASFIPLASIAVADRSGMLARAGVAIFAATFVVLLIPHFVAAWIFASERTFRRFLGLVTIHTGLASGIISLHLLDVLPYMPIVAFTAFIIMIFAVIAIYRASPLNAFLLVVSVNLLSIATGKSLTHLMAREKFDQRIHAWIAGVESAEPTTVEAPSPRAFVNVAEAQAAAIAKYPDLAKAGSPLHTRFLQEYERLQREDPARLKTNHWPWELANTVAAEFQSP